MEEIERKEEFIVSQSDVFKAHGIYSKSPYADEIHELYNSCERIVRCEDCKHSVRDCFDLGYLGCKKFAYDNGVVFRLYPVKPDGFCAWGEVS